MYDYFQISNLNDFIFCPHSIYLHNIYGLFDQKIYHSKFQTQGKIAHKNIDQKKYSSKKNFLQGLTIYHDEYKLLGKIDLFDQNKKMLIERKYFIKKIYFGYKLQIYAQYLCLIRMGYRVDFLRFHSLKDNKNYDLEIPNKNAIISFEKILKDMRSYCPDKQLIINNNKCQNCIYSSLCERRIEC